MARPVEIEITGDSRSAERAFDRTSRKAREFSRDIDSTGRKLDVQSRRISSFARGAAAGFVGAEVFNLVSTQVMAAVDAASNLNEQVARSGVVFRDSAGEVQAWAKTTADSIGVAEDKALEAASTFGAMFSQAGQGAADAAQLSEAVVQLGGDLASFANTSVDDALLALRSGLSGEIEPLRRYQVFLTEASVAQQAMADTGKTNVQQLTQGEKIMARWKLILDSTAIAQGDAARTADGYANTTRRLQAQARNLQIELGEGLLPVLGTLVDSLLLSVKWTNKLVDALGGLERQSDHLSLGDLFAPIWELPDVFRKSLKPPWDWKDVADSQAQAFTADMKAALEKIAAGATFGITPLTLPTTVSPDQAASNAEALAGARGDLDAVLAAQIKRRDALGRMLELWKNLGYQQKKLDELSRRYTAAQVAVIGTQKQIAANDESARKAAEASAEAAAATAKANAEAARDRARAAEQARQYRLIGLSPTGGTPIPTIANLRRQFEQIRARVAAGDDLPAKMLDRFAGVAKALRQHITPETRDAIAEFFRAIRDEWKKGDETLKPFATAGVNTNAVARAVGGLTAAQNRRLRAAIAGATTAGKQLAPSASRSDRNETTIYLDGQVVGRSTKRYMSSDSIRAPMQKRGPFAGRG